MGRHMVIYPVDCWSNSSEIWLQAPPWAMWLLVHEDGGGWWTECEPFQTDVIGGFWSVGSGRSFRITTRTFDPECHGRVFKRPPGRIIATPVYDGALPEQAGSW
jgi:hypothetical protein